MSVLQRETYANENTPIYADAGSNVNLLIAGPGISLTPPSGLGAVTVTAFGGPAIEVDFTNNVTPIQPPIRGTVPTDSSGSQILIMRCEADDPTPQNNVFDMTLGGNGVEMASYKAGFTAWGWKLSASPLVLEASNNWDTGIRFSNAASGAIGTLVPNEGGRTINWYDASANAYTIPISGVGEFLALSNQTVVGANTPTPIIWDNPEVQTYVDISGGFPGSDIVVENAGRYRVQTHIQLDHTGSGQQGATMFVSLNGTAISNSGSYQTINANQETHLVDEHIIDLLPTDVLTVEFASPEVTMTATTTSGGGGIPAIPAAAVIVQRI
jgi:hypothetical protein